MVAWKRTDPPITTDAAEHSPLDQQSVSDWSGQRLLYHNQISVLGSGGIMIRAYVIPGFDPARARQNASLMSTRTTATLRAKGIWTLWDLNPRSLTC
jgi:hypothetical protein